MSYTLNIEPGIVKEAESCALRNGTTVDAIIRACLLVLVSNGAIGRGDIHMMRGEMSTNVSSLKIGSMRDEIQLPDNFDEAFDSLDQDVASMFGGTPA